MNSSDPTLYPNRPQQAPTRGDILKEPVVEDPARERHKPTPTDPLSTPRRVGEEPVGFSGTGQEEEDQERRDERYQGPRGGLPPADVQGLFDGDGCDERSVGDGEERGVGYPEHGPYPARVAQSPEDGAESAARGRALKDDEHEHREAGDQ